MKAIAIAAILLLAATGTSYSQQRHGGSGIHPGGQHGFGGHPGGWSHWGHRNDDFAGGILGGIIGGAIGQIFAPEPEPSVVVVQPPVQGPVPWTTEWYDYCQGKYKSFDAKTGYWTGYDSIQHFCR